MGSQVKNLYNVPSATSLNELFYRRLGLKLAPGQVTYSVGGGNTSVTDMPFAIADGVASTYPLLIDGHPLLTYGSVTAVYRTDWQGTQLLSPSNRGNFLQESDNFGNQATWPDNIVNAGNTRTNVGVAPNGEVLWKLTKGVGSGYYIVPKITPGANYNNVNRRIFYIHVMKDADVSRFPAILLTLQSQQTGTGSVYVQLNTMTGATAIVNNSNNRGGTYVLDLGTYWRWGVWIDGITGTVTQNLEFNVASGAVFGVIDSGQNTGSVTVFSAQYGDDGSYIPTTDPTAYGTYFIDYTDPQNGSITFTNVPDKNAALAWSGTGVTPPTLTVTANATAADGSAVPYTGSVTYALTRVGITAQLPETMVWSGNYPMTVQALADYLMAAYGYYLEDGEFVGIGDATNTPLVRGGTVLAAINPTTLAFQLAATSSSQRWVPGSLLNFRQVTSNSISGLNGMTLTGIAPQGIVGQPYDFTYTVTNGTAPFTFSILQGTPPAPLNPSTGQLYTADLTTDGTYNWIVQVVDALGHTLTLVSSTTVIYPALVINPPSLTPTVSVGVPFTIPLGVSGGKPPYTYGTFVGALPTGSTIDGSGNLVGTVDGNLTAGTTTIALNVGLSVTDSLGVNVQRLFVINVNDRTDPQITSALSSKVLHWFNEAPAAYDPQGISASYLVGGSWRDLTGKLALLVDGAPLPAVAGPGSATWRGVDVSAGYAKALTVAYNLPEDFAIVSWLNYAGTTGVGQHIVGRGADVNGGWAVERVAPGNSVGLGLTMSGVPELTSFTPVLTTNPGDWYFTISQMKGNVPEFEINAGGAYYGTPVTGVLTPNNVEALFIGIDPALDAASKYDGSVGQLAIFTDKLWSDERKWLYNAGIGRLFPEIGFFPTLTLAGTLPAGNVASAYSGSLTLSGGNGTYVHGTVISGTMPPGLTVTDAIGGISNDEIIVTGTPTVVGNYTVSIGAYSTDGQLASNSLTISIASVLLPPYATAVMNDSPVVYYRCDDNAATDVITPIVGSPAFDAVLAVGSASTANTSTVSTAGLITGDADTAFNFTANQFIRAPTLASSLSSLDVFTFECVINPSNLGLSAIGTVVNSGPEIAGSTGSLEIDVCNVNSTQYYFRVMQAGVTQLFSTGNYNYGTKVHVALRCTAVGPNGAVLFVNGVNLGTFTNAFTLRTTDTWRFGAGSRSGVDGQYPYTGILDEIALYNAALTDADIAAHAALI